MQKMKILVVGFCILLIVISSGCTSNQPGTISSNEDENYVEDAKDTPKPKDTDTDGDGYNDDIDAFPYNPNEWRDSDNDGVGDNSDAFPNNQYEQYDNDNDGVGDNADAFPYDSSEWIDSDSDGHGDNSDVFPYDSNEWADSDKDGIGNNADAFPYDSTQWTDRDGDGYGDNINGNNPDAFPDDASEWKDSDSDGIGDNSDSYPYDYDNDGYADSIDIDKYRDIAIKISFEKFIIVDEVDIWPFGDAEVYFEIYINEIMKGRIDYNGESFVVSIGQTKDINDYFVFNIPDNQRYTDIKILMWDDDGLLGREIIDIDGHDDSNGLSIVYDAVSKTWSGDGSGSSNSWGATYTDGREDGSWDYDDNDGILWYDIALVEVEYDKTYTWNYNWGQWSLHINIPRESLSQYKHSGVDRNPSLYETSKMKTFVTSSDAIIVEIANKLKSLADTKSFNYYETVNFVLRFVQSLEYVRDNVSVGSDDYWRFSVETLVEEIGDCEDTSILFASIMEAMGYDAVLFLFSEHVAVGILGYEGCSGTFITYAGYRYYYCETAASDIGWSTYDMGDIPSIYQEQSVTIVQVE